MSLAKQKKSTEKQADEKKQAKHKPTFTAEFLSGQAQLSDSANPVMAASEGSLEAQAAHLNDSRFQPGRRQAMASQIGQKQGNQHLQRALTAAKNKNPKLVQKHWLPGEEEEIQTKSLLQRHLAPTSGAIQKHWLPDEEEAVQTKPLQRQTLPGSEPRSFKPSLPPQAVRSSFGDPNRLHRAERVRPNLWGNQERAGLVQRWKKGEAPAAPATGPKIGAERVTLGPITFAPNEIPADGKTTSQASVTASPGGGTIKWEFVGEDYGSTINAAGQITPGNDTKGAEKAVLRVKASDDKQAEVSKTGEITLWDAKFYQAKQDFPKFMAGSYQYPNFTIGLNGKFDVDYQPAANLANINVKVKFTFPDDETPKPTIWNYFGLGNQAKIDAAEARHKAYRDSFMKQIKTQWSGRYQFKNVREPQSIWGKLNPTSVKVNVLEVDADQHFLIEVRQKTKGRAQVGGGVTKLFQGSDIPAPAFNPGTAQGELARVARNTPTPILFAKNNSTDIPATDLDKLKFLGTYLSRINNPKFNLDIVGHSNATGDKAENQTLSEKRAQAVAAVLTGAGATQHQINASGVGQTGADKSAGWRKVEITSSMPAGWQNMQDVTAHEFGHMIGLGDEYAGGGSPNATHFDLVKKAFGQEYADQVAKRGDTDYASIMEGGNDVRLQHYVTFWSGLCETTMKAAVPDPKFGYDDWKFIG